MKGLAEKQSGQSHIYQNAAVAVVPVQRQQAALARSQSGHFRFQSGKFLGHGVAITFRDEVVDEP